MGDQAPLALAKLAKQRLLRDEPLIISSLEDLPVGLFPEIFEEALTERRTNILRAMVPAWPFPCLPIGALKKTPCLETWKVMLDGLNVLITEKPHPRRTKLRVLDLTYEQHDIWRLRIRNYEGDCQQQAMGQMEPVEICPKSGVKKPFMVVMDLKLTKARFSECDAYVLCWAQQQKCSVHLCCRKLHVCNSPVCSITRLLKIIHLDCILQLELSQSWLEFAIHFFPYLGQMKNLHTFTIDEIHRSPRHISEGQRWIHMLLSQLSTLPCLKNLHVKHIDFLTGCLEEWLRCVTMPLEALSVIDSRLSQSDLDYLMRRLNICELRHLKLSTLNLSNLCPKLLEGFLKRLKSTLQTLELVNCVMNDFHFKAIMPALSQCSQLTKINFYYNDISLLTLKNLLHHTARLSKLTQEMYPAPRECYGEFIILKDKFQELCPQLLDILKSQREPKGASFATRACLTCFRSCLYDSEARLCPCEYIE